MISGFLCSAAGGHRRTSKDERAASSFFSLLPVERTEASMGGNCQLLGRRSICSPLGFQVRRILLRAAYKVHLHVISLPYNLGVD